jgi:cathepsin L
MQRSLTLALLGLVTHAKTAADVQQHLTAAQELEFLDFVARKGKQYHSVAEVKRRQKNFL